jgi:DHA1 family inner membrane transport protein
MPAATAVGPATRHLRFVDLLILATGTFTLGVDGLVLSGLLPQVASDLHVSLSAAGQLTTLFAIVYAIGSPVISALTGDWDRRTLLAAGMAVFIVGMVLQASGPVFLVVAAGRVVAALGAAAFQANAYSTAGLLSDDAHRARSLAVLGGGASLALVAGLPFGILVGQAFGWRNAMWILVGLATIAGLAIVLLPPAHAPRLRLRERLRVLSDARVRGILLGTVAVRIPYCLVVAYLPTVLHAAGLLVVVAMLAFGCGQAGGIATVPLLIRRYGARGVLVLGAVGVTVFAATLAGTRTVPAAAVATMFAFGFSVGLTVVPQQDRLFTVVPRLATVAMGLNGSALYVANGLGAALGGGVLTVTGASALAPAAAVTGLLAIAAGVVIRPERPMPELPTPEIPMEEK